jgi:hypothetical protein
MGWSQRIAFADTVLPNLRQTHDSNIFPRDDRFRREISR